MEDSGNQGVSLGTTKADSIKSRQFRSVRSKRLLLHRSSTHILHEIGGSLVSKAVSGRAGKSLSRVHTPSSRVSHNHSASSTPTFIFLHGSRPSLGVPRLIFSCPSTTPCTNGSPVRWWFCQPPHGLASQLSEWKGLLQSPKITFSWAGISVCVTPTQLPAVLRQVRNAHLHLCSSLMCAWNDKLI